MARLSYIRPYIPLGTHIKSHAVPLAEFQRVLKAGGSLTVSIHTEYYNGNRIYTVCDTAGDRVIRYNELITQELEPVYPEHPLFPTGGTILFERVNQTFQEVPLTEFVNHATHQHVRQKSILQGPNMELEILLCVVNRIATIPVEEILTALAEGTQPENVLSLSYRFDALTG